MAEVIGRCRGLGCDAIRGYRGLLEGDVKIVTSLHRYIVETAADIYGRNHSETVATGRNQSKWKLGDGSWEMEDGR